MRSRTTLFILCWLGIQGLTGCANPERKAAVLLAEASRLVQVAQEAEKTSFVSALSFYQDALAKAESIIAVYPSSAIAQQLRRGEVKIGPYTLIELKDTIIPRAKSKAEDVDPVQQEAYDRPISVVEGRRYGSHDHLRRPTGVGRKRCGGGEQSVALAQ